MNAAFRAMTDAIETHHRKVARIEFWHRWRMRLLIALIAAEPLVQFVRWAWHGFPVVGK